MRKPYFYIIKHILSKKYYAGCKINSKADSSDLMTEKGYQTTSKIIKNLILNDGLDSFKILRIKHFETSEEAINYETRFLVKVDAANNIMFYNRHNGGKNFVNRGGYKLSESTKQKMRKPKSKETIEKQNQEKRTRSKEVYKKAFATRKQRYSTWHTAEQIEQIKQRNAVYWTEETKKIHSEKMKEVHKLNPISEETRQKHREKSKGANNGMFGKTHNKVTREKMKLAWQKRKEKRTLE
jgi:hypothetical protein